MAREHSTPKLYVYNAISNSVDEPSLLRLDIIEEVKLDEQDFKILSSSLTSP